jgi:hypothetical protein
MPAAPIIIAAAAASGAAAYIGAAAIATITAATVSKAVAIAVGTGIIAGGVTAIQGGNSSDILNRLGLKAGKYILLTAHRSENVDNQEYLQKIIKASGLLANRFNLEVIYPMHPRTKSKLEN